MPKFLTREELYRVLQRELPENVYPDGPPSGFYSTADMDSIADCAATGYVNLDRIYENYFPQSADERIASWEITVFARNLDAALTLEERRTRIVDQIRARRGITLPDMIQVVKAIIGQDKLVEAREWGCSSGGWMISESQLGIETFLNAYNLVDATGPNLCAADPADFGKTEQEWLEMKEQAYTYEILIYDYTLTAAQEEEIDTALSATEPARSQHFILDGLDSADMISGDT